jgi:hypothetical protein
MVPGLIGGPLILVTKVPEQIAPMGTLEMFTVQDGTTVILAADQSLGEPAASGIVVFKGEAARAQELMNAAITARWEGEPDPTKVWRAMGWMFPDEDLRG